MEDNKIIEDYFRALGWKWIDPKGDSDYGWYRVDAISGSYHHGVELPNILKDYDAFKEWAQDRMEGEGYKMDVSTYLYSDRYYYTTDVEWWPFKKTGITVTFEERVKDGHILRAAVIAATKYWESER